MDGESWWKIQMASDGRNWVEVTFRNFWNKCGARKTRWLERKIWKWLLSLNLFHYLNLSSFRWSETFEENCLYFHTIFLQIDFFILIIIVNLRSLPRIVLQGIIYFEIFAKELERDGKLSRRNLPRFSRFLCLPPRPILQIRWTEICCYYIPWDISGPPLPFFLSFFLLAITWGHGQIPLWPEAFERCPGKRHPRRRSPSTSPPRPPPAPCPPRREFLLEGRLSGSLSTRSPHDPRL